MSSFFLNTLSWWQWIILLAIPPAIAALYFLKLKRVPLEVPSTFLWRRTIEDLHVNSFWQRLRSSLLLWLQLLLLALAILACLRPGWRGETLLGHRFIFLVDVSASMNATDILPTRLEEAKRRVGEMLNSLESGDVAMLVSFSDVARIEQQFTDNHRQLRTALANLQPTERTSDLGEALRTASGLANPGSSGEKGTSDSQVADAQPATVYIFSDGGFGEAPDFSAGSLSLVYVPLGSAQPDNVGIVAFKAETNLERNNRTSVFGRLENCGAEKVSTSVELLQKGVFLARSEVTLPPGEGAGVQFDLANITSGTLELQLKRADQLSVDDRAFAIVQDPRPAKVLLVSPLTNSALEMAMRTEEAAKLADVALVSPDFLASDSYRKQAREGSYELIVFDQCTPAEAPPCNAVYFGAIPPGDAWRQGKKQNQPRIIDADRSHPIMRHLSLENLIIHEGTPLQPPSGSCVLIDSDLSAPKPVEGEALRSSAWGLAAIGPRGSFEDLVIGFEIASVGEKGGMLHNTDWPIRLSFPLFVNNMLAYFRNSGSEANSHSVQPGHSMVLKATQQVDRLVVESPQGGAKEILRQAENTFVFGDTSEVGIYKVSEGSEATPRQWFAVNIFDARESDIRVRKEIYPGHEVIAGQSAWTPKRTDLWKYVLLLALGALVFEWYVYNKRIFV